MRVAFWISHNPHDVFYHRPLGVGYIKAYLDANIGGHLNVTVIRDDEGPETLKDVDVLMVSSLSQDFGEVQGFLERYKQIRPSGLVIVGGQHITNFPDTLPDLACAGVIGEGEISALELLRLIEQTGGLHWKHLEKINGLVFRDGGNKLIKTAPRPMFENMDELPFPDRIFSGGQKAAPYILTSRGCPYNCTFCSSQAYWKKARYFSAEYVVREIKQILSEYKEISVLGIWDDLFVANRARLKKIKEMLISERLLGKLQMACNIRANLVTDSLCETLKEMSITAVSFGFESGDDDVLKALKPVAASVKQNIAALETLRKHQIPVCCSFIVGVPGETEEQLRKTYNIILECVGNGLMNEPHVNILMPMPGTFYWRRAVKDGVIDEGEIGWRRLRYYACYRDSMFGSIQEWAKARRENHSYYMNEETLPELRLLELMIAYENKIDDLIKARKTSASPYKYWAPIDMTNVNNAHTMMLNNVRDGSVTLECGCSGGHMTEYLAKKGCVVDGVDIDPIVSSRANIYARRVMLGDLDDPEFRATLPKNTYEFIAFGDILEHLRNPGSCLQDLAMALKQNGKVVASIPNVAHGSVRLKLFKGDFKREEMGILDKTHIHFFTLDSAVELFTRHGYLVERIEVVAIPIDSPITGVNLDEHPKELVNFLLKDETATDFQYIIVARPETAENISRAKSPDVIRPGRPGKLAHRPTSPTTRQS